MANSRLWFGPLALLLLAAGIIAIGLATPHYSQVQQTVSELGEVGAPGQWAFTALLILVGLCLMVYAVAVAGALRKLGRSTLPAYFIGAMAISASGVGIFAFPHPLHNVFGMSELIGYQAPLLAALALRRARGSRGIVVFSAVMYCLVLVAIAANLSVLDRDGSLWQSIQPFYGAVQRVLFAAWFLWCAGFAVLLMRLYQRVNTALKPTPLRGAA